MTHILVFEFLNTAVSFYWWKFFGRHCIWAFKFGSGLYPRHPLTGSLEGSKLQTIYNSLYWFLQSNNLLHQNLCLLNQHFHINKYSQDFVSTILTIYTTGFLYIQDNYILNVFFGCAYLLLLMQWLIIILGTVTFIHNKLVTQ